MSHLMGVMWAGFITEMNSNVGLEMGGQRWPEYTLDVRERAVFTKSGSWVEEDRSRGAGMEYINSIQHRVLRVSNTFAFLAVLRTIWSAGSFINEKSGA